MLASLMGGGAGHVSVAVSLEDDPEPVVGSFTVDGMTFAVVGDGEACLVSVGSPWAEGLLAGSTGAPSGEDSGSGVPTSPSPSPEGASSDEDGLRVLSVPESVEHDGAAYAVIAVGPRALAGCDADAVVLPASVETVDELAFRGSAVASVEVADGNSTYSSYDGMLFDAEKIRLLLIPEGKQGAALIPSTAESAPPSAFSHCAGVTSVSVGEGSADLSSRNGLLYDASGETLLRVPAGAEEIEIYDGCTAVAPGALEGCARLRSIQAPASVAEVAPDVLGDSTVGAAALPVGSLAQRATGGPDASDNGVVHPSSDDVGGSAASGSDGAAAIDGFGAAGGTAALPASVVNDAPGPATGDGAGGGAAAGEAVSDGFAGTDAEAGVAESAGVPAQLSSLVALSAASDGLPQVDPASVMVRLAPRADPAPWEAVGFAVEVAEGEGSGDVVPEASSEGLPGEPLGTLAPDYGHDLEAGDSEETSAGPVVVDEVTVGYGYANERSSANGAYERALPKVDAVLRLQPVTAEDLAEGRAAAGGDGADAGSEPAAPGGGDDSGAGAASSGDDVADAADSPTLASRLADLPEESQATASFLYEGCLYVIDPEGGAALVAVDRKRLAECVEDPTTLILPDYVDDGTWAYPLTRIAKGAFRGSGIERLWIPASATYLDYALEGCETLRYVEISEDSPVYSSRGGCLYDKSGEVLWMMPEGQGMPSSLSEEDEAVTLDTRSYLQTTRAFSPIVQNMLSSSAQSSSSYQNVEVVVYYGGGGSHELVPFNTLNLPTAASCSEAHTGWSSDTHRFTMGPYENSSGYPYSFRYYPNYGQACGPYLLKECNSSGGSREILWLGTSRAGNMCTYMSTSPEGPELSSFGKVAWVSTWADGSVHYDTNPVYMHCANSPRNVTITWSPNNGAASSSVTCFTGTTATGPSPTRTGYTFAGWYTAASGGSYVCGAGGSVTVTSDVTYYAHWNPITYNVRYFDHAGNHRATDPVAYDASFSLRSDPGWTGAGYTAQGWARSRGQTAASNPFGQANMRNLASTQGANVDFYVAESPNPYSVRYFTKAGTHIATDAATYGATFSLRGDPGRTTPGYTAVGWARSASQSAATHAFGQPVSNLATSGNADFYLAEVPNSYSVTLDAAFPAFTDGSTYAGYGPHGVSKDAGTPSVTATYDSAMPSATMPRATGYRFEGYFDDAGTKYYDADGSSARAWDKPSGATLHGCWAVERHELTLDVGDGEVPDAAARGWVRDDGEVGLYRLSYSIEWRQESGGSPRIQLPARAAKPGYAAFEGWVGPNLSKPSTVVQVQPWELVSKAYTGVFSGAIGYAASLDLAGGSFASAPEGWSESGGLWSHGFTVESEAFSLPTPARPGHDFQGWALVAADGSLGSPAPSVTVPKGTVGDRSCRAMWQARTYTVTWHYSGQTIDGRQSVTADQAYGAPIAFPARPSEADPAREHYSFEGWFTAQEGGERIQAGDYLLESDSTFYARWAPVGYVVHLHLGDDDAYAEHKAAIEQGGQALPMAPDGHFDLPYTVEDEVALPTVTDDPDALKPVREGMSFVGWVECAEDGGFDADLVPSMAVTLPKGSHGDRHFRALWSFALRFEVPSAVSFRFDLADDPAFADAPYGPVAKVEGEGVELRSLSLGRLAVADVALDVAGARPDDIVTDRSKVSLRVMDATLSEPWCGWVPLPTTSAPERLDPFDLEPLGFGGANAVEPLSSKPLRYEARVNDADTTLAGEVDGLPLAKVVFTVKGLW